MLTQFVMLLQTSCKPVRAAFIQKNSFGQLYVRKSIVIRNRKIVWRHVKYLLIFSLELEISGVAGQRIHQNSEKLWLLWGIAWWKWLWDCFRYFLLIWLWCQRFLSSSKDLYRLKRLSQILLVCYSLLNSQNITITVKNKGSGSVTRTPLTLPP